MTVLQMHLDINLLRIEQIVEFSTASEGALLYRQGEAHWTRLLAKLESKGLQAVSIGGVGGGGDISGGIDGFGGKGVSGILGEMGCCGT